MSFHRQRAVELLRLGTGVLDATFHDGQAESIEHVVDGRGRLLVVQRTGWGKSMVYFIATRMLRDAGHGPILLVSPLLALMRNQIESAARMGVHAATINSDNQPEWDEVFGALHAGKVDILLVSPERLALAKFRTRTLTEIASRVPLLVVDEAHCISDWGHDFRPHYRLIRRLIEDLPANVRLLATTATANQRVMNDLAEVLGPDLTVERGPLGRSSLTLQTLRIGSRAERMAWLAERIPNLPGTGIVYTLTVRDATRLAEWLRARGVGAVAYSSRSGDDRERIENDLLANKIKVVVATSALGMGFDKPDLGFVVHYQMPGSVVAYYQQVGRAGRAIDHAYALLLSGDDDDEILDYFVKSAFPSRAEVAMVIDTLTAAPDGLTTTELEARVDLRRSRLAHTMQLLALESPSPIAKQGTRWLLTPSQLSHSFWERVERITEIRMREREQMREYLALRNGHMEFLIDALDGIPEPVSRPPGPPLPSQIEAATVAAAIEFLRRTAVPIEPRKQWVVELPVSGFTRGRIADAECCAPGLALSMYGDPGSGESVKRGKYEIGRFDDQLVEAAATAIADWSPTPPPVAVTCVPSSRHPNLVPDLARRLAEHLRLPFIASLREIVERPAQKSMQNSAHQLGNLDGRFDLVDATRATIATGPLLLVDDIVDSRWTFTVCAALLRRAGCPAVHPFALAESTASDD